MGKAKITIAVLAIALVLSNVWWVYRLLDAGVTQTYMGANLEDHKHALTQSLTLLPVVARPGVTRKEILAAVRLPGDNLDSFEKDGFVWIGKIGLKFDAQGRLVAARRSWEPE